MSGEVYLASENLLIDAKGIVIEKRRKPVRNIQTSIFSGQFWGGGTTPPGLIRMDSSHLPWAEENLILRSALSPLTLESRMTQDQLWRHGSKRPSVKHFVPAPEDGQV